MSGHSRMFPVRFLTVNHSSQWTRCLDHAPGLETLGTRVDCLTDSEWDDGDDKVLERNASLTTTVWFIPDCNHYNTISAVTDVHYSTATIITRSVR